VTALRQGECADGSSVFGKYHLSGQTLTQIKDPGSDRHEYFMCCDPPEVTDHEMSVLLWTHFARAVVH
jgi:hypothetical protein